MANYKRLPRGAKFLIVSCLCLSLAMVATVCGALADSGGMILQGVNISGAEFNTQRVPGDVGFDYLYPSNYEINYFASKGMNVIRLPFSWERMQPSLNGPLDQGELWRMDPVVSYATSLGLSVVLDPHDYGPPRLWSLSEGDHRRTRR
jgi:endoglucanase